MGFIAFQYYTEKLERLCGAVARALGLAVIYLGSNSALAMKLPVWPVCQLFFSSSASMLLLPT